MTNTGGRVDNTKNEGSKVRVTERRLALTSKFSMLVLAATMLAACGDGSGGSGGAAQVSVPNVVGDSQAAATTALTGAGLSVGAVTQASSATAASGNVISETPVAGTSAASGSSVALVVSSGPASVSVPNVVGDTQAAATTALTGAGLTVGSVSQQSSSTLASGDVISENPPAVTSVAKGSAVALVVSSGPPKYTIGGTLIGLAPTATVHVHNGAESVPLSANGSFTLPTTVASGGNYSITVGTPTSTQICGVQKGSGTIAAADITNVVVYCTYNVDAATLKATYTSVGATFNDMSNGVNYPYDYASADTFDGVSAISSTYTLNVAGSIMPDQKGTSAYAVTTANAIPSYADNSPGLGGIEGANGSAIVSAEGMASGTQPRIYVAVRPDATATTDSVNGNYTEVDISDLQSAGDIKSSEGNITLSNGTVSGTLTSHTSGTITTGNQASAQFTVTSGIVTVAGHGAGAVSADGDLVIVADTNSGDNPNMSVLVRRGTGATEATLQGVYSVTQYGGISPTAIFAKAITLFAYGNGTFFITQTKNSQGTIATGSDSGTYTVADDGTLTYTDADGIVGNGAISADGNVLVLGNITSGQSPTIWVGVRQ